MAETAVCDAAQDDFVATFSHQAHEAGACFHCFAGGLQLPPSGEIGSPAAIRMGSFGSVIFPVLQAWI